MTFRVAPLLMLCLCCSANAFSQIDFALEEGSITDAVTVPAWSGTLTAGLNGKSGNSQNMDINLKLDMTRESDFSETNFLASYFYADNNLATTTDRWFSQLRQERKFEDPLWSWYAQAGLEVDRFKDFDYRIALHSGLAYKLIDEEHHKWKLRSGAGASKEVGSSNKDWSPELQFGTDWERKLSKQTRIYLSLDYFPNVSDFSDFRLNTNTGLDFLLDTERNINLRLFATNRYDSTPPAGNLSNDIDYGMALVVGF